MTRRVILVAIAVTSVAAAGAPLAAGMGWAAVETLRLRITGEGTRVSDVCDAAGHCPTDREKQVWTISISPAGVEVEGQLELLLWGTPNADEYEHLCYVAGTHRGQFRLKEIEWDDYTDEGELIVEIEPLTPPSRGAQASGSCPQVIPNTDGQGRPYDGMVATLEQSVLSEHFVPISGARELVSEELPKDIGIIRQFRLEVLEGDLRDLDRYLTLRDYLEPLKRRR